MKNCMQFIKETKPHLIDDINGISEFDLDDYVQYMTPKGLSDHTKLIRIKTLKAFARTLHDIRYRRLCSKI